MRFGGFFLPPGLPGRPGEAPGGPKCFKRIPRGRSDQERPKKPQDGPGSRQEAKMGPRSALRTAQGGSRRLQISLRRPQEQAPGRQLAPPRRDGKTTARSAHGKTSARSARETASPETPETREIYHETTTPRYRERLIFTATPPDHGKRERFTTRPPDHGHRDRCTFSAGAPDHGKRASFTVGPPDKRGNLGGQPLHQLLFQTPLSVFSQVRFWAWGGALGGSFRGFFGPRAQNRENHDF